MSWPSLRDLLKTRDFERHETPFGWACSRHNHAMLLNIVELCPEEFVLGKENITGMVSSVWM